MSIRTLKNSFYVIVACTCLTQTQVSAMQGGNLSFGGGIAVIGAVCSFLIESTPKSVPCIAGIGLAANGFIQAIKNPDYKVKAAGSLAAIALATEWATHNSSRISTNTHKGIAGISRAAGAGLMLYGAQQAVDHKDNRIKAVGLLGFLGTLVGMFQNRSWDPSVAVCADVYKTTPSWTRKIKAD